MPLRKNFNYVPEDSFALHPKRLPIKFASKEQGEFFKDKTLLPGGGGKAILDSGIFSPNRVSCESEFNRVENFSRQSILENEVLNSNLGFCADSLVGMTEILKELKNGKISKPKKAWEKVFEHIENITQFMDLVRQTNYRAKSFSIATCVSAKKAIRQDILNKYNGTENIKEKLLASNFNTSSIFGPIPKDLYKTESSCGYKQPPLTLRKLPSQTNKVIISTNSSAPPTKKPRLNFDNRVYFDKGSNRGFNPNWDRYADKRVFQLDQKRGGKQKQGGKASRR